MKILYITYDGLTDHIGQSQVLPYLVGSAEAGHRITVISFEKVERLRGLGGEVRRQCAAAGIDWRPQRFRSKPPLLAKAIDVLAMRKAADQAVRSEPYDLIHCRSYPAASVGLRIKRRYRVPLLFDMRGFWPDQRREGGRWRDDSLLGSALYRHWKKVEASLLAQSDHIIVLTSAARHVVAALPGYRGAPISVVPCCADFELFHIADEEDRQRARAEIGIANGAPVLVYLGSLGTVYRLDALLGIFAAGRSRLPKLKILFIGSGGAEAVMEEAKRLNVSLAPDDIRCIAVERAQVPALLAAGDVGLCVCTPTFSSLGVSPTKLGEYLATGLPTIANAQIGDFGQIVEAVGCGHVLPDLSAESLELAGERLAELLRADSQAIRERAARFLDLRKGVAAYEQIYADISRPVALEA